MAAVQRAFETIGFAKVSTSAHEAVDLGYLRQDCAIALSRDHLIAQAPGKRCYAWPRAIKPPEPPELVPPGVGGRLAIESRGRGLPQSGPDLRARRTRRPRNWPGVLTGGDRADGIQAVDEQYFLDLEREAFVSLAGEPKSQARMAHMLKTGKPLRN